MNAKTVTTQENLKELGQMIRIELARQNMSVSQLSRSSKVNRLALYSIMNGKTYNIRSLLDVAEVLGLCVKLSGGPEDE